MNTLSIGSLFLEGLLSFFSPCVLPLVPLYIGYLTKDAKIEKDDGTIEYARGKTMVLTIGFVLGICTVFVLASLGSSALHQFFIKNTFLFQVVGGIILVLFGLVSLHVIRVPFLEKTHMKTISLQGGMSFVKAWMMGFFFSFAWSPCIGPMLAQAIVKAASAETAVEGYVYIGAYALGFILVFLLLGLFTSEVLNLLKKYSGVVKFTGVIAGLVVTCMGGYTLYQAYNTYSAQQNTAANEKEEEPKEDVTNIKEFNFQLKDADGKTYSPLDFNDKVLVLDFFGTWCYYCNEELPGLKQIQESEKDVQIILIATPNVGSEGNIAYIEQYLKDKGYDFLVLYDQDLKVTEKFAISGYPTSYFVKPGGDILGYLPGYADHEYLMEIIQKCRE